MSPETIALYLLVRYYDGHSNPYVRTVGPFPSHALCSAAGRDIDPADRRFWSAAERARVEAAEQTERARLDAAFADLRKRKPSKDGWYAFEGQIRHYDARGENDGGGGQGRLLVGGLPPSIITGCVTAIDPALLSADAR